MFVRLKIAAALCSLSLVLGGCAHDKHDLTKNQAQNRAILASLDALQTAYDAKDVKALEDLLASDGEDAPKIRTAAAHDFESFASVSLQIWPDRIFIGGSQIEVSCHWAGDWLPAGLDRPIRREGNAALTFTAGDPPRLRQVVGDFPFGMTVSKEPQRERPL